MIDNEDAACKQKRRNYEDARKRIGSMPAN